MKPWEPNLTQWKGKFEYPKQTPFNDHYDAYLKNPKLNNLFNASKLKETNQKLKGFEFLHH